MSPNTCHRIGYGHGFQATAITKDPSSDRSNGSRNDHTCQATTTIEGIVANACHAVRDDDGCQTTTAIEDRNADAGHTVSVAFIGNGLRNDD